MIATLFDPNDAMKGYDTSKIYPFIPDQEGGPDVCKLRIKGQTTQITITATCDSEPMPCSGNINHVVEEVVYSMDAGTLDVRSKVLQERIDPLCD